MVVEEVIVSNIHLGLEVIWHRVLRWEIKFLMGKSRFEVRAERWKPKMFPAYCRLFRTNNFMDKATDYRYRNLVWARLLSFTFFSMK